MQRTFSLVDLPAVVQELQAQYPTARLFTLTGDLGAGKTTLVAEFCRQIGIEDDPSSPTFSIVNEYHGDGLIVFHIDCYRLKDVDEALAIGFEDYLDRGDYCFIEWPQVIEPLLPSGVVHLQLSHSTEGQQDPSVANTDTRTLSVTPAIA
ncbi:MAG: tRNA (adenosine(37)-N6)-threonylcarbamoyltransferase complex ATPase subunit type 1 TsaE [Bacteroidota bacterium]